MRPEEIFSRGPEAAGGEPVFSGTRVPVRDLVDHLESGEPINDFTSDLPGGVGREQAVAFLEWALDAARRQESGGGEGWMERVPEPWASVLRVEMYSRARKARRVLDAAVDEEDHTRAREKVREMGFDPDGIPRLPPHEEGSAR